MTDIYQTLCNGEPLPDTPRIHLEKGLCLALVRALAESNTTVFYLAHKELNDLATRGELSAIPSSFQHRDVRAALTVGREMKVLPHTGHIRMPQNFEADFVRVWSWAAQLDDMTFFDQMLPHAVRLNITPVRFPQKVFDGRSDAIRWDLYDHLAQRNDVERIKILEGHWNFLENTLLNPPQTPEELMESQIVNVMRFVSSSIKNDAWETFEWFMEKACVKPSAFLLQMVSGVALTARRPYLDKMFEVFPNHQQWIFHFFSDGDKSGQSTEGLDNLLAHASKASEECLRYLVSSDYERNTTRRRALAQYAESILQHQTLSATVGVDETTTHNKKAKL